MKKQPPHKTSISRKQFLKTSAAVAAGTFVLPRFSIGKPGPSANSRLNLAVIGAAGVAHQTYSGVKGENIIALVDVDSSRFGEHAKRFPEITKAETFTDFRVMLDKLGDTLDGVCINTPDHTHFAATMDAMQRKLHVATQKPLTHDIWQARTLRKAAEKYGVTTVMGNQGHTTNGIRQFREWYEAGVLGNVTEAHSWVGGPGWGNRFFDRPDTFPPPVDPVPDSLDYDLWLGPVAAVPFHKNYHPRRWRGFYRFGGGQYSDWFCHTADSPVWSLDLYEPTVIELVEQKGGNEWATPDGCLVRYEFPRRGTKPPCTFHFGNSNGAINQKPKDVEWDYGDELPKGGTYYKGSKANAYTDNRSNNPRLTNRESMKAFKEAGYPEEKYARVSGGPFAEWVRAIKGEGPEPGSNFDYGSRLTEVACLGVLATRFGGRIEWDAKNMKATNRPELDPYIKEPVRKGWEYGEDLWS
jgi:predicted dehydrogenase